MAVATSYSHTLSTGDRTASITVTSSSCWYVGYSTVSSLINGSKTDTNLVFDNTTATGHWIQFQFPYKVWISEAKWYQQTNDTQGTWKWQGSNNGSDWTDIGSTFTLGATEQTQSISTIKVGYTYYRLIATAGNINWLPYIYEIEFKMCTMEEDTESSDIPDVPSVSYETDKYSIDNKHTIPDAPTITYETDKYSIDNKHTIPDVPTITYETSVLGSEAIDSVKLYDASPSGYVTYTTEANNDTANDVPLLNAVPASGDAIYLGVSNISGYYVRYVMNIGTAGVGTYTITWEYYNGSTWVTLTTVSDLFASFKTEGMLSLIFEPPIDWATLAVDGVTKYWIRGRVSSYSSITTVPLANQIWYDLISTGLDLTLNLDDTLSLSEQNSLMPNKLVTETFLFSDYIAWHYRHQRVFVDNVYFTDQHSFRSLLYKILTENLPLSESLKQLIYKALADTESFQEFLYTRVYYHRTFFDNIVFSNLLYLLKTGMLHIIENIETHTIVDALKKSVSKAINNVLSMTETKRFDVVKTLNDEITLSTIGYMLLIDSAGNIKYVINETIPLSDLMYKKIMLVKNETIALTAEFGNENYLALQDTLVLEDKLSFNLSRFLSETLPLSETIAQFLETEPIYFDSGEAYPEYVIGELRFYGGAEMHFYPNQAVAIRWKIRQFESDDLVDPDSFEILVKDPKDTTRVQHIAGNLQKISTGYYKYIFQMPSDVIEGDWYVSVSATKGIWTTKLNLHFEVKKK